MSNSSLATYRDTNTVYYSTRTQQISRITIHHAAGICSMSTFSSLVRNGTYTSWNYAIDSDGKIGLFVEESKRAWTSANEDNDQKAVNIMVSNSSNTDTSWPISSKAYDALIELCIDVCTRNGITKLTYTGELSGSNLTRHDWFKATECPGMYLGNKFPDIVKAVNAGIKSASSSSSSSSSSGSSSSSSSGSSSGSSSSSSSGSSSSGSSSSGSSSSGSTTTSSSTGTAYDFSQYGSYITAEDINDEYLQQYIVTVTRATPNPDYSAMMKNRVSGVIIEAGYLYNAAHIQVYPRNPYIESQCYAAEDANMPFGLYWDCKARSVSEAKDELYELSFMIRKYPPALGMWIHLSLTMSTSTNNSIVDAYQSKLVDLGLKDKIGFYVTRTELNKITWSKYQEDWYLWLVDHVSNVSAVETLLQPSFFMLNSD